MPHNRNWQVTLLNHYHIDTQHAIIIIGLYEPYHPCMGLCICNCEREHLLPFFVYALRPSPSKPFVFLLSFIQIQVGDVAKLGITTNLSLLWTFWLRVLSMHIINCVLLSYSGGRCGQTGHHNNPLTFMNLLIAHPMHIINCVLLSYSGGRCGQARHHGGPHIYCDVAPVGLRLSPGCAAGVLDLRLQRALWAALHVHLICVIALGMCVSVCVLKTCTWAASQVHLNCINLCVVSCVTRALELCCCIWNVHVHLKYAL